VGKGLFVLEKPALNKAGLLLLGFFCALLGAKSGIDGGDFVVCGIFFCNKRWGWVDYIYGRRLSLDGSRRLIDKETCLQAVDWQLIVREHGPAVWQTAYRLLGNETDAADCFQETFVSALEASRRQQVRNVSAFLARIATSRAINRLRRRNRESQRNCSAADPAHMPASNPGPVQETHERDLAARLQEALGRLPEHEAEVFCLRHLNNMSYRQIGKTVGVRTGTAGVLLHRARTKLRNILEGMNEVPQ
jgi:RNA polymerase sigma-70 factor (ECF subfamily)